MDRFSRAERDDDIYARRIEGHTLAAIGREFNLTKETIRGIALRMERKAKWHEIAANAWRDGLEAASVGGLFCLAQFQTQIDVVCVGCFTRCRLRRSRDGKFQLQLASGALDDLLFGALSVESRLGHLQHAT